MPPANDIAITVNVSVDGGLTIIGIDTVPTFSLTLLLPLIKPISTTQEKGLIVNDHYISDLLLVESVMIAIAVDLLPMFTLEVTDGMVNDKVNSSLFSTTLSHTKSIRATAWVLPGIKVAIVCLEAKSTPPV